MRVCGAFKYRFVIAYTSNTGELAVVTMQYNPVLPSPYQCKLSIHDVIMSDKRFILTRAIFQTFGENYYPREILIVIMITHQVALKQPHMTREGNTHQ